MNLFYELFAQYYSQILKFEEAIGFSKSGLGNYIKVIGVNNLKTA